MSGTVASALSREELSTVYNLKLDDIVLVLAVEFERRGGHSPSTIDSLGTNSGSAVGKGAFSCAEVGKAGEKIESRLVELAERVEENDKDGGRFSEVALAGESNVSELCSIVKVVICCCGSG